MIKLTTFTSHSDQAVTYISISTTGERQNLNAIISKHLQTCHFKPRDISLYGIIESRTSFGYVYMKHSVTNDQSILVARRDWIPVHCDRGRTCSLCCNICWWLVGDWGEIKMKEVVFRFREKVKIMQKSDFTKVG